MVNSIHTAQYRRLRELLVDARKNRRLSQAALADKLGQVQTFVSKYERGERRLDVVEFLHVAESLDIDPYKCIRQIKAVNE